MTLRTDYIYSADSKFIMVDARETDLMLAFVGADEGNENGNVEEASEE